jgi:hypothetical protein
VAIASSAAQAALSALRQRAPARQTARSVTRWRGTRRAGNTTRKALACATTNAGFAAGTAPPGWTRLEQGLDRLRKGLMRRSGRRHRPSSRRVAGASGWRSDLRRPASSRRRYYVELAGEAAAVSNAFCTRSERDSDRAGDAGCARPIRKQRGPVRQVHRLTAATTIKRLHRRDLGVVRDSVHRPLSAPAVCLRRGRDPLAQPRGRIRISAAHRPLPVVQPPALTASRAIGLVVDTCERRLERHAACDVRAGAISPSSAR